MMCEYVYTGPCVCVWGGWHMCVHMYMFIGHSNH